MLSCLLDRSIDHADAPRRDGHPRHDPGAARVGRAGAGRGARAGAGARPGRPAELGPPARKRLATAALCMYTLMVGLSSAAIHSVLEPISDATGLTLGDLNAGTRYVSAAFVVCSC